MSSALKKWNERGLIKVDRIGLTYSEFEEIEIYIETNGIGLIKPRGNVEKLLVKYGYKHPLYRFK
ncbi:hypothetical protein ACQ1Q5_00140 [Ornithobacterium rhinotracheale]